MYASMISILIVTHSWTGAYKIKSRTGASVNCTDGQVGDIYVECHKIEHYIHTLIYWDSGGYLKKYRVTTASHGTHWVVNRQHKSGESRYIVLFQMKVLKSIIPSVHDGWWTQAAHYWQLHESVKNS